MSCSIFQAVAGADKSLHQLIAQQAGQLLLRMTVSIRSMTMMVMMMMMIAQQAGQLLLRMTMSIKMMVMVDGPF